MALVSPSPGSGPHGLRLHAAGDAQRPAVEDFIRRVYDERYGARVAHFAPTLVSLADARGDVVAAAGYRAMHAGRPLVVHGVKNKLGAFSVRLAPRAMVRALAHSSDRSAP